MTTTQLSPESYIYYGNLLPHESQFATGRFVGLALEPKYDRDVRHDARDPLPLPDGCIQKIQSQDVFEHLPFDSLPGILDEIYRVLASDGLFRLSLPDYNSPVLRERSVFDCNGRLIADMMMGASISYDRVTGGVKTAFKSDGDAHLWFPTAEKVRQLIIASNLRLCARIEFHHCFDDPASPICKPFADAEMPVLRAPPRDMRADGKPISIIVDFTK